MKLCPKCNSEHSRPGIFCSRSCANSRIFSKETNDKRSISNSSAIAKFTDEKKSSRKKKWLESYRETKPQLQCKCGKIINSINKYKMCWDCYIESDIAINSRGHHYKNYERLSVIDSLGNSVLLMSSMEIAYYNYLTQNSIRWAKPSSLKYIDDKNKLHRYRPDFLLLDANEVIEIKGYWWNNDKIKMQWVIDQNSTVKIKIIMKTDLRILLGDKSIGADTSL